MLTCHLMEMPCYTTFHGPLTQNRLATTTKCVSYYNMVTSILYSHNFTYICFFHDHSIYVLAPTTILCYCNVSRCIITYFPQTSFQRYLYYIKDLFVLSVAKSLFHFNNLAYKQHLLSSSENNATSLHLIKCLCSSFQLMNCHHIPTRNHQNQWYLKFMENLLYSRS